MVGLIEILKIQGFAENMNTKFSLFSEISDIRNLHVHQS